MYDYMEQQEQMQKRQKKAKNKAERELKLKNGDKLEPEGAVPPTDASPRAPSQPKKQRKQPQSLVNCLEPEKGAQHVAPEHSVHQAQRSNASGSPSQPAKKKRTGKEKESSQSKPAKYEKKPEPILTQVNSFSSLKSSVEEDADSPN